MGESQEKATLWLFRSESTADTRLCRAEGRCSKRRCQCPVLVPLPIREPLKSTRLERSFILITSRKGALFYCLYYGKLKEDVRWGYGLPPASNANFAWLQHMIYHLAPSGKIGMVLANGVLSSQSGGEG